MNHSNLNTHIVAHYSAFLFSILSWYFSISDVQSHNSQWIPFNTGKPKHLQLTDTDKKTSERA